jgi:exosome complex RNA-binding protein Rrp42 (RNase PH superfamily)
MFSQARPTNVVSGLLKHAAGSALVKQGDTKVLSAMSVQVGQPAPEQPDHGDVWVTVSTADHGRSDVLQAFLQRMLDDLLPPRLALLTGKACIRLVTTVLIMQDAGNVMDTSLLACMAAWNNTVLPTMEELIESEGRLMWKEGPVSSVDHNLPSQPTPREYKISLSMGVIKNDKGETQFLVDPSLIERQFSDAYLTIVVTLSSPRALQVEYSGSVALTTTDLALAAKMANGRADELAKLL